MQFELPLAAATAGRAGCDIEIEEGAVGHRALGGQLEAELHGVGHDGAQLADLDLDAVHAPARGMLTHRVDNTLRDRHLVHVCPLAGAGDPTIRAPNVSRLRKIERIFAVDARSARLLAIEHTFATVRDRSTQSLSVP